MKTMVLALIFAYVLVVPIAAADDSRVSVVKSPPTEGANASYVGNRPPLLPNPLIKLPIGNITPKGWLRGQLVLEADGFSGRLTEISPWCKFEGSAWASPKGEGVNGWEELPYWLKGFGDLGYVLKDERIIAEARKWIDAVLASQEPDGYFGPRANRKKRDLWPNMPMLNALQSFHEATGDPRVIAVMTKFFRWQFGLPRKDLLPDSWQKVRAGDNIESVFWLYNRTGEPWLLDLAKALHEQTIRWDQGVASWHGVNIAQGFREPAVYYVLSKDRRHLDAAERNYQTVLTIYGQVPGGGYGADENCRPGYHDPRQGTETCSWVELMHSFQMLFTFTGDPTFADRCEDVAFNSFPPSMTPDLKGLHYLTAPNQTQLDKGNKSPGIQNGGCMFAYDPHDYRCCQHNAAMGWPYYAEHLWLATRDNGLAAVLYAASQVRAKVADGTEVTIEETTDYPFAEAVTFGISTSKPVRFPLYLRVPRWCEGAKVGVNGDAVKAETRPLSYVRIDRTWADGDKVRLELPMKISMRVWRTNADSVSIDRGPLTYSLKIGEKWVRYGGTDKWPAYEVYPTTPWNYGLLVDELNPAASFKVVTKPGPPADQPFKPDAAPIELIAQGKRIPAWDTDPFGLVGPLQGSPVKSDQPVEHITLIPMGCARLRISAFPTIGEGPEAQECVAPPAPRHTASHSFDHINAVSDGVVPKSSNDHTIPRFTWWDHRGTTEWITWSFDRPRKVSTCEVYWFDDTGVGHCRVPASWRLLYRDGRKWKDVTGASVYGTNPNQFNRATFDAVMTDGMKIEVRLRKDFSGGILEWKVE